MSKKLIYLIIFLFIFGAGFFVGSQAANACVYASPRCTANGIAAADLSWDPYTMANLISVSYDSWLGLNSPPENSQPVGSSTSYTWPNLTHNTTYYMAAVAHYTYCTQYDVWGGGCTSTASGLAETSIYSFTTPDCSWIPGLRVFPTSATIYVGQAQQFTAEYDPDGNGPQGWQNVTTSANWSSANSAIATVDNGTNKGLATARGTGSTTISATYSGLTASATLTVPNRPPVANAGPDKEVFEGQQVVLEGSGSDPDGDPITYSWSCDCGTLSNRNIAQPTYTAPIVNNDRNCTCTLTVRDNKGLSASDSMIVRVKDTKLYVSLAADPTSGRAPLRNVDLTATVLPTSTAIGNTANYTFWCHCTYTGTNIHVARAQCGNWNHKADNANPDSYTAVDICNYLAPAGGSYTPKVIVEKGSADAAQAQVINLVVQPNQPPQATNLRMSPSNCTDDCKSCPLPLNPILYWDFTDSEGDFQTAFQIQIAKTIKNFNPPNLIFDPGKRVSASQSYPLMDTILSFNETYYWRVRVWDSLDVASNWAEYPGSYRTPIHAYPEPNFSWSPLKPPLGKEVQFTDQSQVYAGSTIASWQWTFQDAYPGTSSEQNPITTFSVKPGNKTATLLITDSDGLFCDGSKTVVTTTALPKWREIIPW